MLFGFGADGFGLGFTRLAFSHLFLVGFENDFLTFFENQDSS